MNKTFRSTSAAERQARHARRQHGALFALASTVAIATFAIAATSLTTLRRADQTNMSFLGSIFDTRTSACGADPDLFPQDATTEVNTIAEKYHSTVSRVIFEHQRDDDIMCTPTTVPDPPTNALRELAGKLERWKGSTNRLSESNMAEVLLEYLSVFECTLHEGESNPLQLIPEQAVRDIATQPGLIDLSKYLDVSNDKERRIFQETTLARKTLKRTLTYLSNEDRLRPLRTGLICLERASLDLRNVLGLAADTSACLPRVWDARTALRNLAPPASSSVSP